MLSFELRVFAVRRLKGLSSSKVAFAELRTRKGLRIVAPQPFGFEGVVLAMTAATTAV
jgi:hypothetical protein